MTPAEKAKETRKKHMEAQKKKSEDKKRITEAIVKGCLSVLADESSSTDQRMEAIRILNEVGK